MHIHENTVQSDDVAKVPFVWHAQFKYLVTWCRIRRNACSQNLQCGCIFWSQALTLQFCIVFSPCGIKMIALSKLSSNIVATIWETRGMQTYNRTGTNNLSIEVVHEGITNSSRMFEASVSSSIVRYWISNWTILIRHLEESAIRIRRVGKRKWWPESEVYTPENGGVFKLPIHFG